MVWLNHHRRLWMQANASVSASLATCYYYMHVLPTLRIGLQFQCRWPGDHAQNRNFSKSVLELICSISITAEIKLFHILIMRLLKKYFLKS